jgi:23S rRNA (cytosine1962-C5)-methyltransferase
LNEAEPDRRVRENGVWYALDLQANRDAGLYLDTRSLRRWLKERMAGARVLNTFAYTGSLGVAALAGGAARVVHVDLKRDFLNIARTSYTLNGFAIHRRGLHQRRLLAGDESPDQSR